MKNDQVITTERVIELRRELHQFPELSGEEWQTSKLVQEELTRIGIPFAIGYAKTGVLGVIEGTHKGGVVALRADMDALPIQEETNDLYASKIDGVMHACGHDAHTAMLIETGRVLFEQRDQLAGTVLLVFQPSEEKGPLGGAKPMMEDGVFDRWKPDVVFGQHVWPDLPVGTIGVRANEMMGASDRFTIEIKGQGGHASMPHQTNDAIIVASSLIANLQTVISRNMDPLQSSVLTIGTIEGGYRYNVVADRVTLTGTVRTFEKDIKEQMKKRLVEVAKGTAATFDVEVEVDYVDGYPPTINTPEWAECIKQTAMLTFGEQAAPEVNPSLGGEDFSRFLEEYPGAFFWLGTGNDEAFERRPLHDSRFQLDEAALPVGVKMMTALAKQALNQLSARKSGDK
ncbi:M20 metallopeptidase family protein [Jeotgalibacillus soli]|uniref:Carboxypeptidase n=1 Tax=Jeotgalibacillus soli TaxID=889306 RepID=A0A0C2RI42_9BACL|nr:M20 family metallopeptidase [Jeotgalibacillus soli]KIL49835.1 carboxypeptidase [Jeotgalibacillus soli]